MYMAKRKPRQARTELVTGYEYGELEAGTVKHIQACAARIRTKMEKTLKDMLDIGRDLLAVKEHLPHGQFGAWLEAEFSWKERTARNFMAAAERFSKSATLADLPIDPTAAYLLAAPSTPETIFDIAVHRAEQGEHVTTAVVREILVEAGPTKRTRRPAALETVHSKLLKDFDRWRESWSANHLAELAQILKSLAAECERCSDSKKEVPRKRGGATQS